MTLIGTKPYVGNDGTTGIVGVFDGEPTAEQRAQYASCEWAVGSTYAPTGTYNNSALGPPSKSSVIWGIALFLSFALFVGALVFGAVVLP